MDFLRFGHGLLPNEENMKQHWDYMKERIEASFPVFAPESVLGN